VENQEKKSLEEELSAKKIFKIKSKAEKHVLDMYLASDNEHIDIFEGSCVSLRNLSLELNTPLPASAACEHLILRPHRTSLTDKHFEACLLIKLNHKFCK
jgi:hypothetical protein